MIFKNTRNWLLAMLMTVFVGGSFVVVSASGGVASAAPAPAATSDNCNGGFLGFPSWYRGLTKDGSNGEKCMIMSPSDLNTAPAGQPDNGMSKFIWHVTLNIVEIALVAIAYIASAFILYGGFLFIISRGNPEGAAKARQTILDAVIGLIISMAAVAIVNFIVIGII